MMPTSRQNLPNWDLLIWVTDCAPAAQLRLGLGPGLLTTCCLLRTAYRVLRAYCVLLTAYRCPLLQIS
eukprot:scaffold18637_cov61-Phaeocystis_antarctica.AAC.4